MQEPDCLGEDPGALLLSPPCLVVAHEAPAARPDALFLGTADGAIDALSEAGE